jgi:hypothetical protein
VDEHKWGPTTQRNARRSIYRAVVWNSAGQDGSGYGIYGQRFNSSGAPAGGEFRANTYTTGDQNAPVVAMAPAGVFMVVWQSDQQDGSAQGIYAQFYDASGNPIGIEQRINVTTQGPQAMPAVWVDASGNFTVFWSVYQAASKSYADFARRYDSTGQPVSGEITMLPGTGPAIGAGTAVGRQDGGAVVVTFNAYDIFAQLFDSALQPKGPAVSASTIHQGVQSWPVTAVEPDGSFTVVWESNPAAPNDACDILAQRFDALGNRVGGQYRVNTTVAGNQRRPAVASDAAGNLIIAWASDTGPDGPGVYAQRYDSAGSPVGSEFKAFNATVGVTYSRPAIATTADGTTSTIAYAVDDVTVRRFTTAVPISTLGGMVFNDLDGDGVRESGEIGRDGVTVRLLSSSGDFLEATTTSGGGGYRFGVTRPAPAIRLKSHYPAERYSANPIAARMTVSIAMCPL